MYELRPYQREAVDATVEHFKKRKDPALIVLPTGAGKSLVIAELARIARGRVLSLAHVKELVEQNHDKYESYGNEAGIFSAGLNRKDHTEKVIFGSIQSVARAQGSFFKDFSLLIIDECHRVSMEGETQYQSVISLLKEYNPDLCILGLTATPYRLGLGWIYNYHYRGMEKSEDERFFKKCIYELPLSYMIKNKYLTPPIVIDSPVACYDFSSLTPNQNGNFSTLQIEEILGDQKRVTPGIIGHIIEQASSRAGVMIFTSSVRHAREILGLLPKEISQIVTGETPDFERDSIISSFKERKIKFLVNVSVLTTGFDAPHVDLIALLRPTESVSLYQQIIGRGLRLFEGKKDCLVLDYTGQGHDLFSPEVGNEKVDSDSEAVNVLCPDCGHENIFWGKKSEDGHIIEHYGRKCQGAYEDPETFEISACGFLFRFKICESCGLENDISARECSGCSEVLIDPDTKLKEAMQLKDAHVLRCDTMNFEVDHDKKGRERLSVRYYDYDGEHLSEYFYLARDDQKGAFFHSFVRPHLKNSGQKFDIISPEQVVRISPLFRMPKYVIARKVKNFWKVREKVF
ncbi:putative DEAD box helicase family protein [Halobacteriovorax marinus SJ]|uniref:DEAD box helicase family protein n=1 Tax=Halobacteriovorax marinus (strain ATCC BAA-682 / DSM 15412 / SJ) TaxID=862908 RepID=E1WXQ0_HALMS|nr:DEAD/DEAH box helicase [Halobacteriovorax marinus]CBW25856.1 putative DEAD box helicase family protein [Halobacteriovorax marinus SJ]